MHLYEVFHVVLADNSVTFLSMDDALAFVKDMATHDFVLCTSKVTKKQFEQIKDFRNGFQSIRTKQKC